MNLEEAKVIYHSPKGHSKKELCECLRILNAQPHEFNWLQALAIEDAHIRLGIPLEVISEEPLILPTPTP